MKILFGSLLSLGLLFNGCERPENMTYEEMIANKYKAITPVNAELEKFNPKYSNGWFLFIDSKSAGIECDKDIAFLSDSKYGLDFYLNGEKTNSERLLAYKGNWYIRNDLLAIVSKDEVLRHFDNCLNSIYNDKSLIADDRKSRNENSWK